MLIPIRGISEIHQEGNIFLGATHQKEIRNGISMDGDFFFGSSLDDGWFEGLVNPNAGASGSGGDGPGPGDPSAQDIADALAYNDILRQLGEVATNQEFAAKLAEQFVMSSEEIITELGNCSDFFKTLGKTSLGISIVLSFTTAMDKIREGESAGKAITKFGLDVGAGALSLCFSGPIGICIAITYIALDKSGVIDRSIDIGAKGFNHAQQSFNSIVNYINNIESALHRY